MGRGFPKFKSKKWLSDSFRIPQPSFDRASGRHIKITKEAIDIPKMGWIKWIRRPIAGLVKSTTIRQIGEHCFVNKPMPLNIRTYDFLVSWVLIEM